jgi:hypothetical protein
MIYQSYVGFNKSLALPGSEFHNGRNSSTFATGASLGFDAEVGTIVVRTNQFDQGRLTISQLSAANNSFATNGSTNFPAVVMNNCKARLNYNSRTIIGTTTAGTSLNFVPRNTTMTLGISGVFWVICEKAITAYGNNVFVRFQAPAAGGLEGIGYVTDTTSVNHVQLPNASFFANDSATMGIAKDPTLTAALDRARIGMSSGFSCVPIQLRYGVAVQ